MTNIKTYVKSIGICALSLFWILCFGICHYSYAQSLSSTELINNARQYDGKLVVFEGEAIGDVMRRGNSAWVNLNDIKGAIGVWLSRDLAALITYTGSYKSKGDWVEIRGVFQRACPEHGADLDIHAQSLRIVSAGNLLRQPLHQEKKNFSLILLGVLCLVLIFRLFKQQPRKN